MLVYQSKETGNKLQKYINKKKIVRSIINSKKVPILKNVGRNKKKEVTPSKKGNDEKKKKPVIFGKRRIRALLFH